VGPAELISAERALAVSIAHPSALGAAICKHGEHAQRRHRESDHETHLETQSSTKHNLDSGFALRLNTAAATAAAAAAASAAAAATALDLVIF
jgi:hypothetical protein